MHTVIRIGLVALLLFTTLSVSEAGFSAQEVSKAPRVAVFFEPGFPYYGVNPQTSSREIVRRLRESGVRAELLGEDALSDTTRFNAHLYAALALPYGNTCPAKAFAAIRAFHQAGGALILSGIPFTHPVARVQVIALPGVEGRIDHMAADPAGKRLYMAALGNNTLEVMDLGAGKRVHTISGLHEPQGIRYVPSRHRLFVANGQSGDCVAFDATSFQKLQSIALGDDADNVRFEEKANRVYVGYGGGAIGILDAGSYKNLGNIALAGHPESFQLEEHGSRIFVNVPDAGQIAVLDRRKQKAVATWPVTAARSNFPMALDEANHRLFVGCRAPSRLLVYDTHSGKVTASLRIVGDTDDLFYDASRKRLYISGGEGYLDVVAQESPDHYTRLQHIPTAPGARTSFFVPELSRLYVAVPHRGNQATSLFVFATGP